MKINIKIIRTKKGIVTIRTYPDGTEISVFMESEKQVIDAVYDFLRETREGKKEEK